jgi:hypothetical protein
MTRTWPRCLSAGEKGTKGQGREEVRLTCVHLIVAGSGITNSKAAIKDGNPGRVRGVTLFPGDVIRPQLDVRRVDIVERGEDVVRIHHQSSISPHFDRSSWFTPLSGMRSVAILRVNKPEDSRSKPNQSRCQFPEGRERSRHRCRSGRKRHCCHKHSESFHFLIRLRLEQKERKGRTDISQAPDGRLAVVVPSMELEIIKNFRVALSCLTHPFPVCRNKITKAKPVNS